MMEELLKYVLVALYGGGRGGGGRGESRGVREGERREGGEGGWGGWYNNHTYNQVSHDQHMHTHVYTCTLMRDRANGEWKKSEMTKGIVSETYNRNTEYLCSGFRGFTTCTGTQQLV